ncbi:glutamate decarboxylase-like [Cryptomeria japonica]|uniref:glutamate decarboxylase-like n=1 Tax=Cryptomeria japonica TaxID=3369 RepID=UPI0027D9D80F|nr:glutamate decarboxylase-like [Cryptomeria japonica]
MTWHDDLADRVQNMIGFFLRGGAGGALGGGGAQAEWRWRSGRAEVLQKRSSARAGQRWRSPVEAALLGRWWLAGGAGAAIGVPGAAPERHANGRARSRSRRKVAGAEAGREPEEMQRPAGTGDGAGGGRRNSSGGRRPEAGLTGLTGLSVRYPTDNDAIRMLYECSYIPKEAAYQIISDELMLDRNPRLNLASFVTTWMEPECSKLIMEAINKNYVDMDEYPVTTELQNRCVNIIARMFHAPISDKEQAIGVGTVGSSEAIMLAGLAFKRKWQNKRKAQGKPYDKPNIVTGANVQVCWEKFARYFEVELKEVKLREGYYVMDPRKAVELVDENTICVAAILGSTYNGEFEDVKLLNDLLMEKNNKNKWDTPIHVDAASGGFIAPFLYPNLEWDFRLPLVRSINVSGHKYGLVYAGIGWVVWRGKQDLPEELIFHINYLGADQPTFTLNFSKGASQVIAQYYQLIRLGVQGYKRIIENCRTNAKYLRDSLIRTGRFNMLSKEVGVPLVAFCLKDTLKYNEHDLSEHLRRFKWVVPAYNMAADAQHISLLRVVIREAFSRSLADRLVQDIHAFLNESIEAREGEGEGR